MPTLWSIHVLENAIGGGVSGVKAPRSAGRSLLVQTSMFIQADWSHCLTCYVLRAVECLLLGYKVVYGGFEKLWSVMFGIGRGTGASSAT
jgi:hypothetical protein